MRLAYSLLAALALFSTADPGMAAPCCARELLLACNQGRVLGSHLKSSSVRMIQKKVFSLGSLANRSSTYASQEWWSISDIIDTEPAAEHSRLSGISNLCWQWQAESLLMH